MSLQGLHCILNPCIRPHMYPLDTYFLSMFSNWTYYYLSINWRIIQFGEYCQLLEWIYGVQFSLQVYVLRTQISDIRFGGGNELWALSTDVGLLPTVSTKPGSDRTGSDRITDRITARITDRIMDRIMDRITDRITDQIKEKKFKIQNSKFCWANYIRVTTVSRTFYLIQVWYSFILL